MPRGALISQSSRYDGPPFRYMTLPTSRVQPELRYIGGSTSVLLFVDDVLKKLVIQRLVSPLGGSPNAPPQILFDVGLPHGLESQDVDFGIFARNNSDTVTEQSSELSNIKAIIIVTKSLIFGMLLSAYGVPGQWNMIYVPPLPPKINSYGVPVQTNKDHATLPPERQRIFLSACSLGDTSYFIDCYFRLSSCSLSISGELHMNDILANRCQLLDRTTGILRTWLLPLPIGQAADQESKLICLRVEHTRPRSYSFRAYEISVVDARTWRSCRNMKDYCIFVNWGSGSEAFAYRHPERVGLNSGQIYDSRQRLHSYKLNRVYQENIMPHSGCLTWPFPLWIHPTCRIPYDPPPCDGPVAEAVPPADGNRHVVLQNAPSQSRLMPAEPAEQPEEGDENGAEG